MIFLLTLFLSSCFVENKYNRSSGSTKKIEENSNLASIKGCDDGLTNWYKSYCAIWFGKYIFSIFMMAFLSR